MEQHVVDHPAWHPAHARRDPDRALGRGARSPAPTLVARPVHAHGLRLAVQVPGGQLGGTDRELLVRRAPTVFLLREAPHHPADPLALLRAGEPRRDRHHDPVAVPIRGDGAESFAAPAHLDGTDRILRVHPSHASARPGPTPAIHSSVGTPRPDVAAPRRPRALPCFVPRPGIAPSRPLNRAEITVLGGAPPRLGLDPAPAATIVAVHGSVRPSGRSALPSVGELETGAQTSNGEHHGRDVQGRFLLREVQRKA